MTEAEEVAGPRRFPAFHRALALSATKAFLKRVRRRQHVPVHAKQPKLRLGGDALGADPTYLLYLPSRSRGELRRIDFEPDCAGATLSDFAASELTRKPLLHTRGISKARSLDLEVTPWAPTRLTSCIFHSGPEEPSGASTLAPGPAQQFRRVKFSPSRPASLQCAGLAFPGPEASTWR